MTDLATETQVLIVDDDPIMGELLNALLTVEGCRVTRALSGAEALQVAREGTPKPSVILCDIQMPGMRGSDLARALAIARTKAELPADTVILAMSGSMPRADESEAFDGFLRKPFSVADLGHAIAQARSRTASRASANANADELAAGASGNRRPPLDETIFEQIRSKVGRDSTRQLYDMTIEDVRARLGRMGDAADRGDQTTVRQEAHTIKGSCGMVGALELQSLAAATEGGSPVDTSALADFDSACNRLERMLNERL